MTKPHREGSGARRAVVWFVVVDLCAMVLIGVAGLALARRVAVNQAKDGAITVVRTDARHVGPLLVPGAVSGDPAATARKAAPVMAARPAVVRPVAAATVRAIAEPRPDHGE